MLKFLKNLIINLLILKLLISLCCINRALAIVVTYESSNDISKSSAYAEGVYSPTQDRIYLVPYGQASEAIWHYIDCTNGSIVPYSHDVTARRNAYIGGVYSPIQNRIYFIPFNQAESDYWHYVNCSNGNIVSYMHGLWLEFAAYRGGVYSPIENKIYFVPFAKASDAIWHYIDCSNGAIVSYAHGVEAVITAYSGGVYSPIENKIYFVPRSQATATFWHYIDCSNGTVVSYAHGVNAVIIAYSGGVYSPLENKIYFIPDRQADQSFWHYIDCSNGTVISYAHNMTVERNGYVGGTFSPIENKVYFVPYVQGPETNWHYIDASNGSVISYAHNVTTASSAYYGGVYSPNQKRIYFVPYDQARESEWHYVQVIESTISTYDFFQSSSQVIDLSSINLSNFTSAIESNKISFSASQDYSFSIKNIDEDFSTRRADQVSYEKSSLNLNSYTKKFENLSIEQTGSENIIEINSTDNWFSSTSTSKITSQANLFSMEKINTSSADATLKILVTKQSQLTNDITFGNNNEQVMLFNIIVDVRRLVRQKFRQAVIKGLKLPRFLFFNNVNFSSVEQALLQSIGNFSTKFNVTSEGNDDFSINFIAYLNTSSNAENSLDTILFGIFNNLNRDEEKINQLSNKLGFDLSLEYSEAVVYATEILNVGETMKKMVCKKSFAAEKMICVKEIYQNDTLISESSEEFDLFMNSSALLRKRNMFFMFFALMIYLII